MRTAIKTLIYDYKLQKTRPLATHKQGSCSSHKRKRLSRVKKTTAVLKRAMTEKRERWQSKAWYGNRKSRWQQPARGDGGQSSHDTWDTAKPKGSGEKSQQKLTQWGPLWKKRKTLGTKVAKKVRREKPNSSQWSKLRPRTKNKRKEKDEESETSSWKFEKGRRGGSKVPH